LQQPIGERIHLRIFFSREFREHGELSELFALLPYAPLANSARRRLGERVDAKPVLER
jgi:hypothetical protein